VTDIEASDPPRTTRRTILQGALVATAVPVLAACGSDDEDPAAEGNGTSEATSPSDETSAPTQSEAESSEPTDGGGGAEPVVVAAVADVPVGGGIILQEQKLVITQPSDGQFRGFSAVCTHQGCVVATVSDTINCGCHFSMYDIDSGDVVGGPAPSPLPEAPIIVEGNEILLAAE
jgi:Rieske Fe-S protein